MSLQKLCPIYKFFLQKVLKMCSFKIDIQFDNWKKAGTLQACRSLFFFWIFMNEAIEMMRNLHIKCYNKHFFLLKYPIRSGRWLPSKQCEFCLLRCGTVRLKLLRITWTTHSFKSCFKMTLNTLYLRYTSKTKNLS